ncbi:EF-hand_domain pair [Hexamita inflata]|uniref:EF-hand domain pair n=1 Tax=Hexamita inflata TaxID=28002 RepID=A0AA86P553_9EUKA|nr:EF-hand domain pair [Hexamita inflata]
MFKNLFSKVKAMFEVDDDDNNVQSMVLNGKGPVDICEIHWTLRKYFPDVPQRFALVIAKLLEPENDGYVSREAFNKLSQHLKAVQQDEDIYNVLFAAADLDNNKTLDEFELQTIREKLRLDFELPPTPMSLEDFKKFMKPFVEEVTGSGMIPFVGNNVKREEELHEHKLKPISRQSDQGETVAEIDTHGKGLQAIKRRSRAEVLDESVSNIKRMQSSALQMVVQ